MREIKPKIGFRKNPDTMPKLFVCGVEQGKHYASTHAHQGEAVVVVMHDSNAADGKVEFVPDTGIVVANVLTQEGYQSAVSGISFGCDVVIVAVDAVDGEVPDELMDSALSIAEANFIQCMWNGNHIMVSTENEPLVKALTSFCMRSLPQL